MKSKLLSLGAAAMICMPALASAQQATPNTTAPANTNGGQAAGQPNQDCQDLVASGEGAYPGNTPTAPGSAFNETDGIAGGKYAGSQPQNSKNPASVSQYDVACEMQPM